MQDNGGPSFIGRICGWFGINHPFWNVENSASCADELYVTLLHPHFELWDSWFLRSALRDQVSNESIQNGQSGNSLDLSCLYQEDIWIDLMRGAISKGCNRWSLIELFFDSGFLMKISKNLEKCRRLGMGISRIRQRFLHFQRSWNHKNCDGAQEIYHKRSVWK